MSSPSPYPYPTSSPSAPPFSYTPTPGSLSTVSPQVFISYIPMPSYSASPVGLPISAQTGQLLQKKILSDVSDDALYGIICAIVFIILYSSIYAVYYYRKYKKEKLRVKRFNELQGKVHSTVRAVLNPVYPA
jgi:hypothetical protein